MTNPISLEKQFQELIQRLQLTTSRRHRILQSIDFLKQLLTESILYQRAYAQELLLKIHRDIIAADFNGTPLAFFQNTLSTILALRRALPEILEETEWNEIENKLEREIHRCALIFEETRPSIAVSGSSDHILVPYVEMEPVLKSSQSRFASIRTLRLEAQLANNGVVDDQIIIDQEVDPDGIQHRQVRTALSAARSSFSRLRHRTADQPLIVHLSFESSNTIIGDSLSLALTVLLYASFLKLYEERELVDVSENAAFTGIIDENGMLHPVNESTLSLKIEAALFSGISTLVIPKSQEVQAYKILQQLKADLQKEIPLSIIGVNGIEEVFFDRRISIIRQINFLQQGVRVLWRKRRLIARAVLLLLMLIIGKLLYGPIDMRPTYVIFEGNSLFVKNIYGETIRRKDIESYTSQDVNQRSKNLHLKDNIYAIVDVDLDGADEIIYPNIHRNTISTESRLLCYSVKRDSNLWDILLTQPLSFVYHKEITQGTFNFTNLALGDADNDGKVDLFISASHAPYFPSIILSVDPATGNKISCYTHVGQTSSIALFDLDNDGIKEVICSGVNQAFGKAYLSVLDPRKLNGHGPTNEDYSLEVQVRAHEKEYILIPRTILGEVFSDLNRSNSVQSFEIDTLQRIIRLKIIETAHQIEKYDIIQGAGIDIFLDFNLQYLYTGSDNEFDIQWKKACELGWINNVTLGKSLLEQGNKIQYLVGEKFFLYPAFQRYQQSLHKKTNY